MYVYPTGAGIECCGCNLGEGFCKFCKTPEEMIQHLARHKKAGHFVPFYAIERLWEEVEGPNTPVHPEPEEMRKVKEMMDAAYKE